MEALALLGENLVHPAHEFWADSLQVPSAVKGFETTLQGYKQLTDAYLLAFAHRRKGVLATCDRGLRTRAGREFSGSVEIVPTRLAGERAEAPRRSLRVGGVAISGTLTTVFVW